MTEEKKTAHKPEACGRDMAYTEKELVEATVGVAFSQFAQTATRDSDEASRA